MSMSQQGAVNSCRRLDFPQWFSLLHVVIQVTVQVADDFALMHVGGPAANSDVSSYRKYSQ